jgi:hypothetical protein
VAMTVNSTDLAGIVKASKNRTLYIIFDPSDLLFPSINVNLWVNQVTCPIINVLDYRLETVFDMDWRVSVS